MRRQASPLLLVVVLALLAGACSEGDLPEAEEDDGDIEAEAPPEPTVWSTIEASAGPDGVVPLEPALQGVEYLFGDLPGVELPEALPDPEDLQVSGSGPLRWVLNHWDQLTPEQQAAITPWIAPPAEPPSLRGRQGDKAVALPILVAQVEQWRTTVGSKLGRTIPQPIVHLVDSETAKANPAWVVVTALDEVPAEGTGDVTPSGGPAAVCNVYFPPSTWRAVASGGAAPGGFAQTVAHELVHCYQGFAYPDLASFRSAPGWIIEGGAEFGGFDASGQPNPGVNNWTYYLTQDADLFTRSYSALGWWMLLQHVGKDPWRSMPAIWAGAQVGVTAYVTAGGHEDVVYDSWGSSRAREPGFGDAWDVHGTAVTADRPPRLTLADSSPVDVAAFDARPVAYAGAGEIVEITANQPIRIHDAAGVEEVHVTEGTYCIGDRCVCPPGTERAGTQVREADAPFVLGVSGGETGTSVLSRSYSLEDWCRRKPEERERPPAPPAPPSGIPPGGGGGDAGGPAAPPPSGPGSNGDPHMVTFDGHRYDFQAVGEFVLAEADAGDLTVHVRQEPYRDSTVVAINTAVAADVAGDVVEVRTLAGGPLEVLLDGTPVTVDGPRDLPGGGVLEPVADGYRVAWTDGTELFALPVGDYGLNLVLRPDEERLGTLRGLLGPYEGSEELVLETRDGERLPPLVPGEAYEQLYGVFGPSWRITDEESLFTYETGETTATFTDPSFPSAEVTLDDLTAEQRERGEEACASITDEILREGCIFDVGVTDDVAFAVALEQVVAVTTTGGDLALGDEVGPAEVGAGETIRHEIRLEAGQGVLLESTVECTGDELAYLWRFSGPDGRGSTTANPCTDLGRVEITVDGIWVVEIDAFALDGGTYGFRLRGTDPTRSSTIDVPGEVEPGDAEGDEGYLAGLAPAHRYEFEGREGDVIELTSTSCAPGSELVWTLEDPRRIPATITTWMCDDLGEYALYADGTWAVLVSTRDEDVAEPYGFTISRR